MADGIDFDFREVEALASSIAATNGKLIPAARAVVSKAGVNVKKDTRDHVSQNPSWKRLAATVNYDLGGNAFYSEATVGYDDVGQGELAGIYEFGSAKRAPHPTLYPAANREAPRFTAALAAVAAKVVEDTL